MNKIKILTTGGTIFSEDDGETRSMTEDTTQQEQELKLSLENIADIDDREKIYNIDSSDLRPENIKAIATTIINIERKTPDKYRGYIITHGTDTMAYTASLLSYLLQGIDKSVILTGSMIGIGEKGSDAPNNLVNSAKGILFKDLKGVYVSFGDKLIKGSSVKKMDTNDFSTFDSPNVGPIGTFRLNEKSKQKELMLSREIIDKRVSGDLFETFSAKVQLLKLTPTTDLSIFDYYINLGLDGLIIEGYGDGNVPGEDSKSTFAVKFQNKIQQCLDNGITIVLKSQCPYGVADHKYKGAQMLLNKGVLSANNMTSESAQAKLMWVLGNYSLASDIRDIFKKNIVGEFDKA